MGIYFFCFFLLYCKYVGLKMEMVIIISYINFFIIISYIYQTLFFFALLHHD
jgi:hypothetical protein